MQWEFMGYITLWNTISPTGEGCGKAHDTAKGGNRRSYRSEAGQPGVLACQELGRVA